MNDKCIVVLSAGGESSRFRNITGASGIQKSAFVLPNGETMIERTIGMYRDAGFMRFVILLYHNAESVIELLGDGSRLGVEIAYSHDPEKPVGRGGAIKHAFNQGILEAENYLIVHNPDDQIVGNAEEIVREIANVHIENEKSGAKATAVMVPGVRYDYTGFTIEDDFVKDVEMYPMVEIPAHIGLTVFSPGISDHFDELFDLSKPTDFEAVLFPVLVKDKKLAAHMIPAGAWIPVNDEKGLKKLIKALEAEEK
ncbi:MAG: NDP-sugar synthase [Candidatus Paceibacterota bacterium]|jgi:NDP-sugar pyrophosphorylase family protein